MIRVYLVENEQLVREGFKALLELDPEVEVVGEASGGQQAIDEVPAARVQVMLLDLRMPMVSGLQVLEALGARGALPPTLIVTTFEAAEELVKAAERGARGYLRKDVTLERLMGAIRSLASGGTAFHPALSERLGRVRPAAKPAPAEDAVPAAEALTPREREVLRLLAAGLSNREIATVLASAEGTVKHHVSSVIAKLAARDRTQAVLLALERGLL